MTLDNGGRELILNLNHGYSAIHRIREVLANFYNNNDYRNVDIRGLCCSLDEKHWELFMDILTNMRQRHIIEMEKIFEEFRDDSSTDYWKR